MALMTASQARENFLAALATLRSAKVRSGLTVLGIVIGVSSVISMAAIIQGLNKFVQDKVESLGSRTYFVSRFPPGTDPTRWPESIRTRKYFEADYADSIRAAAPHVQIITTFGTRAFFFGDSNQIIYQGRSVEKVVLRGTEPQYSEAIPLFSVARGRFISNFDQEHARAVVVLGAAINESLFPYEDGIGKTVKINGELYEVIGIFEHDPGLFIGPGVDAFAVIPFSTFRKSYPEARELIMAFTVPVNVKVETAQDEVIQAMRRLRHVPPNKENDFEISSPDFLSNLWNQLTGALVILTGVISSIGLVVGGIGVMNIMLISVTERTHEIGIRKAIGARRADIRLQFLLEAVALTLVGAPSAFWSAPRYRPWCAPSSHPSRPRFRICGSRSGLPSRSAWVCSLATTPRILPPIWTRSCACTMNKSPRTPPEPRCATPRASASYSSPSTPFVGFRSVPSQEKNTVLPSEARGRPEEVEGLAFRDLIAGFSSPQGAGLRSSLRRPQERTELLNVLGADVPQHHVAQACLRPRFHIEGVAPLGPRIVSQRVVRSVLREQKHRDFMFADLKNQVRPGRLLQVRHPPSQQREIAALQLRQVEGEGNLALEPRLHRVAVAGNHVHRVGAAERRHVQVGDFAIKLLPAQFLPADIHRDHAGKQRGRKDGGGRPPAELPAPVRASRHLGLNLRPQRRTGLVPQAGGLHRALGLDTDQDLGSARRARLQVRIQCAHLLRGEFAVQVGVELCARVIASHGVCLPVRCSFLANALRSAARARESRDITVPIGTEIVSAISWYDISSTSHSRRTSRNRTGSSSRAARSSSRCDRSIRAISGVCGSTAAGGAISPSSSSGTVAFNPAREVRNVFRRMRYIQARKFVPGWNDAKPRNALV